jgi:hypothetical protein
VSLDTFAKPLPPILSSHTCKKLPREWLHIPSRKRTSKPCLSYRVTAGGRENSTCLDIALACTLHSPLSALHSPPHQVTREIRSDRGALCRGFSLTRKPLLAERHPPSETRTLQRSAVCTTVWFRWPFGITAYLCCTQTSPICTATEITFPAACNTAAYHTLYRRHGVHAGPASRLDT